MGKLGERLGKFDDNSAIYRVNDPDQKVHSGRLLIANVIGSILAVLVITVVGAVVGEAIAAGIAIMLALVSVTCYVFWRRKRNKRLTGSPTQWPEPD